MASTSETGHAKNVANFENLISFCTGYGVRYNPSKESIKIPELNAKLVSAQEFLSDLKTQKTILDNSTNTREIVFAPFKKLCTKVVNALGATGASKLTVEDAKTINRKIQGKRADNSSTSLKREAGGEVPTDPNAIIAEDNRISVSQQSFDNNIDHLDKFIKLLTAEPSYIPNETDLTITGLKDTLANLKAVNTAVIKATTPYSNAIIARDNALYADGSGLVEIAGEVKKYVKSVFGTSSPQYKQISGLRFKKRPKQ
jgi:hypothetical protein